MASNTLQARIDACNSFKVTGSLESNHAYLYLPDKDGTLKAFGILQPKVLTAINWSKLGFVSSQGRVQPKPDLGPKQISDILRNVCSDPALQNTLPALGEWDGKEHVAVILGHPDLAFPDKLGAYLGILQVGAHLTIYRENPLEIYVQRRSSEASSYPSRLDQSAAGGLRHNETVRQGVIRELGEELGMELVPRARTEARYDGSVVFSTTRPLCAKNLAKTLEISTKACFSLKVGRGENILKTSNEPDVKGFTWMNKDQVLAALKEDMFKPNSALVMIRFLMARGVIKEGYEENFETLRRSLTADIPLPLPPNLEKYGPLA